jgi:hypothetical protein
MKQTHHSPEQIINKLHDADTVPAAGKSSAEVCKALVISWAT